MRTMCSIRLRELKNRLLLLAVPFQTHYSCLVSVHYSVEYRAYTQSICYYFFHIFISNKIRIRTRNNQIKRLILPSTPSTIAPSKYITFLFKFLLKRKLSKCVLSIFLVPILFEIISRFLLFR